MKLKIISVKKSLFKGDDNADILYFWYRAEREDGVKIEFGSTQGDHEINPALAVDLSVEKVELRNGKISYKEIVAKT